LTNFSERVYEDHELLVENLLLWTRDSKNKLLFVERPDKTQLFLTPERFLLGPSDRGGGEYDDHSRNILLEEFFSSSNVGVPEVRRGVETDAFTTLPCMR
jgi:amyloid beta A4 precursor protein-binding family B protein 1-interacting protein